LIFGKYQYLDVWIPALNGVPVAISCAWLVTLYGSFAIVQRFTTPQHSIWLRSLLVAMCMAIFDVFMEPVAVKLHYWTWFESTGNSFFVAPVQNYAAWFGISFVLGWFALRYRVFETALPRVAWHSYWAQLLYFAIIALGMPS
jgi:putative membrane protein